MAIPRSPVPQDVSTELGRVVERWHQLPLDPALSRAPLVRGLVDALAGGSVPDLGSASLMDQLTVMVHDVCRAADDSDRGGTGGAGALFAEQLTERLAGLRRTL